MKILIISRPFFPTDSPRSFRATELAKEFARQGHHTTVYTIKNDEIHIPFEKRFNILIKDLGKQKWPRLNSSKGGRILRFLKNLINRFLQIFFEYPSVEVMFKIKSALKNENGYDLMISIAVPYPVHWGVASVRKKSKLIAKKWVADCGDPYMFNFMDTYSKPFYFKYLEKWFSRKADYITIPKIEMIDNFYPEFHSKIRAIPQGFKFEDVVLYRGDINNSVPTFAYAGTFIRTTRNPENFLFYLSKLKLNFKFIIYTKSFEPYESYKNLLKEKLEIKEYLPRENLLYELSKMDFLVNISFNPANQAPSKLIDYCLTGRPILSLSSNNVDEELINKFLNGDYTNRFVLNNPNNYRIENVCNQFIALVEK